MRGCLRLWRRLKTATARTALWTRYWKAMPPAECGRKSTTEAKCAVPKPADELPSHIIRCILLVAKRGGHEAPRFSEIGRHCVREPRVPEVAATLCQGLHDRELAHI